MKKACQDGGVLNERRKEREGEIDAQKIDRALEEISRNSKKV